MILVNHLGKQTVRPKSALESLVLILSPFAPHVSEELWVELGQEPGILKATWPEVDEKALQRDVVQIVVQVNGKVRGRVTAAADMPQDELEALVKGDEGVARHLEGKAIRKVIVVPNRLVNIAVS